MTTEPQHDKTNKLTCAPSVDYDQPGHPPSLIRAFAMRSMGSWQPKASPCRQRRLWSDWVDAQAELSLHWVHISFCWFCRTVTQLFLRLKIQFDPSLVSKDRFWNMDKVKYRTNKQVRYILQSVQALRYILHSVQDLRYILHSVWDLRYILHSDRNLQYILHSVRDLRYILHSRILHSVQDFRNILFKIFDTFCSLFKIFDTFCILFKIFDTFLHSVRDLRYILQSVQDLRYILHSIQDLLPSII